MFQAVLFLCFLNKKYRIAAGSIAPVFERYEAERRESRSQAETGMGNAKRDLVALETWE